RPQVEVAGHRLDPRVGDRDQRLGQRLVVVADALQVSARGSPGGALGERPAAVLYVEAFHRGAGLYLASAAGRRPLPSRPGTRRPWCSPPGTVVLAAGNRGARRHGPAARRHGPAARRHGPAAPPRAGRSPTVRPLAATVRPLAATVRPLRH